MGSTSHGHRNLISFSTRFLLVSTGGSNSFLWDIRSKSGTDKLGVSLSAEGLGPLNGGTKTAVDDELRENTEGAANTEEYGVEALLLETIVLEEDTGVL